MKQRLITLLLILLPLSVLAQKLSVESMTIKSNDISASKFIRKDINGKPCALIKVYFPFQGVQFEGNVINPVEYNTNEYWVYMTEGSKELHIKHPDYQTLEIVFSDYNIMEVLSLTTYSLVVTSMKSNPSKQQFTIRYAPTDAIVIIDSKPYQGKNGIVTASLPVGQHDYLITAADYEPMEGSVRLKETGPSTIRVELEKTKSISITSVPEPSPPKQTAPKLSYGEPEIEGLSAERIRDLANHYRVTDPAKAIYYYQIAIDQGDELAITNLALFFYERKDYAKCLKWFKSAAENGNKIAQNGMGVLALEGKGVQKDNSVALDWFKKAAEQGYAEAQYNLGYMYDNGKGDVVNYYEALKWYKEAADQGFAEAQYQMGVHYELGLGVVSDRQQASYWYQKASSQGHASAKKRLKKIK